MSYLYIIFIISNQLVLLHAEIKTPIIQNIRDSNWANSYRNRQTFRHRTSRVQPQRVLDRIPRNIKFLIIKAQLMEMEIVKTLTRSQKIKKGLPRHRRDISG